MNRAVKFNYLLLGVLGGMLAMWACGGDETTGSSGGGAKNANAQESSCGKWEVKIQKVQQNEGTQVSFGPDGPSLSAGEEPFAVSDNFGSWLYTRRCID